MDTKALRQKILDLAIRGKLVPQDPNDESASVFLERIREEKKQMVKEGKLKSKDIKNDTIIFKGDDNLHYEKFQDGTVKCIEDEIPFEVPEGWEWCNLGQLFNHNTGKALNSAKTKGTLYTYITTSNVYWDHFELEELKTMHFTEDEIDKCTVKKGDLLVCEGGDIGRAAIWNYDDNIKIQNHIHRLRPYDSVSVKLYYYILYSYKMNGKINGQGIGLQGLSSNRLHSIIVPLPPVHEQMRIVKILDEVFSNIINLEKEKDSAINLINISKSKILDLAIRGKLVPQNPEDEPASVLLERIHAEKEELIKQGKLKRDKKESIIYKGDDNSYYEKFSGKPEKCIDNELPFTIPYNWRWERIRNLFILNPKNNLDDNMVVSFIPMAMIDDGYSGNFTYEKKTWSECKKGFTHFANGDICFAKISPCFENRKSALFEGLNNGYGSGTTELYILRRFTEDLLPEYVLSFIKSEFFINRGKNTFSGVVGQQRVDKEVILDTFIPIPSKQEQMKIYEKIQHAFYEIEMIEDCIS